MTTKKKIEKLIKEILDSLQQEGVFNISVLSEIFIERPEDPQNGDYSTPVALHLGKTTGKNPADVAKIIYDKIKNKSLFKKIEIAGPGFINFFLSKEYLHKQVNEILKAKDRFGESDIGNNKKINLEFISANPTGPLHVGNARGGFCGDVLARVLKLAHFDVTKEYYVNDMGRQIFFLEQSLDPEKEPLYKNEYVEELRKNGERDVKKAVTFIVGEIKNTVAKMGITYDVWSYESDLYKGDAIEKLLAELRRKNFIKEEDGTLWFLSSQFGDDKDRVLKKVTEERKLGNTYFLSEIAYLDNKFKRGFSRLIIFLGAEHHGYINRLKAAAEALGYKRDQVEPIIMQLVKLMEGGKELKMSKRVAGSYVTTEELLDEIGPDATRFFFLTRNYGNHLNFDLDLAKEQSEKNPVYYVQYAHARICSIINKFKIPGPRLVSVRGRHASGVRLGKKKLKFKIASQDLKLLIHPSELALIKQLIRFPEIIEATAETYQVQSLAQYAIDVATVFHQFYRDCRVISEDKNLEGARLALLLAAKITLENALMAMCISAPEKM